MKRQILFCINLILVMLVTGIFWGTWFTLTRSLDLFPADNFIRIGKTLIGNVAWPMRTLMPVTLLSLAWLCLITVKVRPSFYFFAGSFLLMVITLLITVMVEVPIDNQIKTWTVHTVPDNWTALREKWGTFHALRTVTSVLSFVSLSIGITLTRQNLNKKL